MYLTKKKKSTQMTYKPLTMAFLKIPVKMIQRWSLRCTTSLNKWTCLSSLIPIEETENVKLTSRFLIYKLPYIPLNFSLQRFCDTFASQLISRLMTEKLNNSPLRSVLKNILLCKRISFHKSPAYLMNSWKY